MHEVILIPDSFKGSMSSMEICEIMESVISTQFPGAEIVSIPVADGGEGTVDCFLAALSGRKVKLSFQVLDLVKMCINMKGSE